MIPLSKTIGLIVDCGFSETRVLPVYDGLTLTHALTISPLGSQAVLQTLKDLLQEAKVRNLLTGEELPLQMSSLTPTLLEDILIRLVYINNVDTPAKDADFISFPLDKQKVILISQIIRTKAAAILFDGNDEDESISSLILDSLKKVSISKVATNITKCSHDIRSELAENIILSGGTTMIPGFKSRLLKKVKQLIESNSSYIELSGAINYLDSC